MALYYDQQVENKSNLIQLLHVLYSYWIPCIPSFKDYFIIITSFATAAIHLASHCVLLIHISTIQDSDINDLPLKFHCFGQSVSNQSDLSGYQCPVKFIGTNRIFDFQNCVSEPVKEFKNDILYANICFEEESYNSKLYTMSLSTCVILIVSLFATWVLHGLSHEDKKTLTKSEIKIVPKSVH